MKKIVFILSILFLLFSCNIKYKKNSTNVVLPDNICTLKVKPNQFIKNLPNKLNENSGLIYFDNLFWTFNDSGGSNKLFAFDKEGDIKREIRIKDAKNIDWEDIAQDKKHIYIGDFGNNKGIRKNQKIYKIKKKDIRNKKEQTINATAIEIKYSNQKRFKPSRKNSKFDCEAMIELNNNLYLFSKDWSNRTTTVYQCPKKKGNYTISPIDSFNVKGLITGADVSPNKRKLILVGYKDYKPIAWLFSDITDNNIFGNSKIYMEMDEIFDAQTEGVCFLGNDSILISCESSSTFLQQVFSIDLNKLN